MTAQIGIAQPSLRVHMGAHHWVTINPPFLELFGTLKTSSAKLLLFAHNVVVQVIRPDHDQVYVYVYL